jgi:hypothetical protein
LPLELDPEKAPKVPENMGFSRRFARIAWNTPPSGLCVVATHYTGPKCLKKGNFRPPAAAVQKVVQGRV